MPLSVRVLSGWRHSAEAKSAAQITGLRSGGMRIVKTGAAVVMLAVIGTASASQHLTTDWESLIASRGPYVMQAALPPPAVESRFGNATALWHDDATGTQWAVIGAPGENIFSGAVYLFSLASGATDWHLDARLTAPDGAPLDEFGFAVAIDGDTIAIAAPVHVADFFDGAVYIFVRDPITGMWSQQGNALESTADEFGFSLALRGDMLAVGDPECNCVQTYTRSASTWNAVTKLSAPAELLGANFGIAVAKTYDHLLVGAALDNAIAANQGSAVLYARSHSDWDLQQILRPEIDTSAMQMFGFSVALSDNAIVVGAPMQKDQAGAAHTFTYDTAAARWTEQSLLRDTTGVTKPFFAQSLALSNDVLAIGAPGADPSAAVYRLHSGAWTLDSVLTGDRGSGFGLSVATANGQILVGAPPSGDSMQGAAYVFISDRIFADGVE
jgi:hypothetical protein